VERKKGRKWTRSGKKEMIDVVCETAHVKP